MANNEKKKRTITKRQGPLKKKFLEYVAEYGIIQVACRKTGIGRQTYYRWIEGDTSFAKKVELAIQHGRDVGCDMSESVLIGKIVDKDLGAAKFYLQHNDPRYMSPAKNTERTMRVHICDHTKEQSASPPIAVTDQEGSVQALTEEYEKKLRLLYIEQKI